MEQKAAIIAGGNADQAQGRGGAMASMAALAKALGSARIVALGAVACCLLGFFAYVIVRATESPYTLLFSGLALTDAQELVGRLEGMAVPYRLSPAGDAIMVPSAEALRLRMALAAEGLPVGGTVGYELFDRVNPFTTSDFLGNVNLKRAIEGELARTIGTLRGVHAARVHIVEPQRSLFGREEVKPSASIVLALRGGTALDKRQVAGIRHLVAAAVPGLQAEAVTLVDDAGNMVGEPATPGADPLAGDAEAYRIELEDRLRLKLIQLLERTVGVGKADAAVNADLDFDEMATTAETFDPQSQVVRSTQTTDDASDQKESEATPAVSASTNLPTERAAPDAGAGRSERSKRTEETVNYEISRTVRNQTKRGPALRRLSIAVQVDGTYHDQPDGSRTYAPRAADELAQLAALVRSAAGVDESRGDVVEVVSRPFAPAVPTVPIEEGWSIWSLEGHDRLLELGTLSLLTLAVLFFGVRPIVQRVLPAPSAGALAADVATLAAGQVEQAGSTPAAITGETLAQVAERGVTSATTGELVELRNVHGQVHADLLRDVSKAIALSPEEAVRVVRSWLHGR